MKDQKGVKAKKALALILMGITLLSAFGCNNSEPKETIDIKIWSAPSYVKILQDKDYSTIEEYSSYYTNDTFDVSMYKNEREAGQIILTPAVDVEEYSISLSKLLSVDGKELLPEAMTVYNQKYVDVSIPSKSQTNSILGMTPDALLPYETAVAYGENTIKANENQAIVVEIETSEETAAGVYTGTFKLKADGQEMDIPARVTVWDAVVSSENHLKTSFLMKTDKVFAAEMDASYEMYEKYYEKLLDYRICATNMPMHNVKDFDEYLSQLKKYTVNEKASTIQFFDCANSSWTDYDYNLFTDSLVAIAQESFEDGVNYLSKLVYYLGMIDEPHITGTQHRVDPMLRNFAKARNKAIDILTENKSDYKATDEEFNASVESIEKFPFIVTATHNDMYDYEWNEEQKRIEAAEKGEEYISNPDEEYKITFCPVFDGMNTPSQRENNRWEGMPAWWYGCNYPTNPYPNYHLDEALIPARVVSWMQYNYGIEGNLYWAVNDMSDKNVYDVIEKPENVYEDLANESALTKGEGFLVYPGKMYGLDNFVPSMRLMNIRDGMEEYEVLKATGEKCQTVANAAGYVNYDINSTFSKLYAALYQGSKIMGDHNDFEVSRELLANFAVFADKGTIIANVNNKSFSTEVKIYVSNGVLEVNGKEADFVARGDGKEYTVEIMQTEKENYLTFTLTQGERKNTFRMFVGGKKQAMNLSDVTFTTNEIVNDLSSVVNQDGSMTFTVGAVKKEDLSDKRQRIYFTGNVIKNTLKKNAGVTAIAIEIENPDEAFELSVLYAGTRDPDSIMDFGTHTIKANGTTLVTIETGALKWDFGAISQLLFYMGYEDTTKAHTITIKSVTLTY